MPIKLTCKCGKDFKTYPCHIRKGKGNFCSTHCSGKFTPKKKGYKCPASSVAKMGSNNPMYGKKFSPEHRQKLKEAKKNLPKLSREEILERKRLSEHRRRVQRAGGQSDLKKVEWEMMKWMYDGICPACLKQEPQIKLTIDHIKPLSKGGDHTLRNIQPLCHACNSGKRDHHETCYDFPLDKYNKMVKS